MYRLSTLYVCVELPLYSLRKPKRVRTAFSPAQLLHLERAFEQNRYVVGQERRQLAASLNLSETQVVQLTASLLRIRVPCTVKSACLCVAVCSLLISAELRSALNVALHRAQIWWCLVQ